MSLFETVTLGWDDKKYVIPADRVLLALAQVEEVITLHELQVFEKRGTVPLVRLSQAYGLLLRFAGCNVTDEQVYVGVLQKKGFEVGSAISGLLLMMLPPVIASEAQPSGNVSKGEGSSSKRRTRSR